MTTTTNNQLTEEKTMATKIMNHTDYPKSLKKLDMAALEYIRKDAHEAMMALPSNPNNSYYADEVCYCSDEIARRKRA